MEAVVEVEAVVGALQQLLSMVELLLPLQHLEALVEAVVKQLQSTLQLVDAVVELALPLQHLEALVEAVVKELQSTPQLVDAVVELQPLQLELFQPHMQL